MARRAKPRKIGSAGKRKPSRLKLALLGVLLLFGAFAGGTGVVYYRSPETPTTVSGVLEASQETLADAADALPSLSEPPKTELLVARVKRVVDGDTLVVEYGTREEKVRLLCVDTPESVHTDRARNTPLGKEAAEYTARRLEGRQVRLQSMDKEVYDNFGRRLAYVLLENQNFNAELVQKGYSPYYTKYGKSKLYDGELRRAEAAAKKEGLGVWSDADFLRVQQGK